MPGFHFPEDDTMEGYFVNVKELDTLKQVETADFASQKVAERYADKKQAEGYWVSVWRAYRIRSHL